MAHGSNGAGDGASFAMPPAPGDGIFGMPQAPGDAPILDTKVPMLTPPPEHRTATSGPPPETVDYEGGGIFAVNTPGPAEEDAPEEGNVVHQPQGYDFNPDVALAPPPMLPAPMMHAPPMAAPGMPDVGPPQTHGGVLGQLNERGTLGFTMIAATGGAAAGLYYGGVWGALAGSLFGGAAVSAYRALKHVKDGTEAADKEAITSGTYAVGAAAIGGVIWAKLVEPGSGYARNAPRRKKQAKDVLENADACGIRPVGP